MKCLYKLPYEDYYDGLKSNDLFEINRTKVEECMNQLISRFKINNKKVLSVGSSYGHEEYWFYKAGYQLTLVDIDESNQIRPYLDSFNKQESTDRKKLTYYLGDALDFFDSTHEKFDICYFSGFTPDELRRRDLQYKNPPLPVVLWRAVLKRIGYSPKSWDEKWEPYCELVISLVSKMLNDEGLFISQSYAYGVDIVNNPHFIPLIKKQLKTIGIELLECYYYSERPSVSLVIGFKGSEEEAKKYMSTLSSKIVQFHGRSQIKSDIKRGF